MTPETVRVKKNDATRNEQLNRLRERYAQRGSDGKSRLLDELCEAAAKPLSALDETGEQGARGQPAGAGARPAADGLAIPTCRDWPWGGLSTKEARRRRPILKGVKA